jgi:hypothetical protein
MFWGNSPHSESIFIIQKHIVRMIMKDKPKDSCKELSSKLVILTLYSQDIFSILMFVVNHKDLFTLNMEFHKINTCHKLDFQVPLVSLTKVQKEFIILVSHYLILYPLVSLSLTNLNTG